MQKKIAVFVSLTVLMGLTCLGCDYYPLKPAPPDVRDFQIKVDSVAVVSPLRVFEPGYGEYIRLVPTTSPLAASDTMRILFYGEIGPDGCYTFSHFDTSFTASATGRTFRPQSLRELG